MKKEEFVKKCYEAYKLMWMLSHGYGLTDYLNGLISEDEAAKCNDCYPEGSTDDIYKSLAAAFEETGFSGELWASLSEFEHLEFRDIEYMAELLELMPDSKNMKKYYSDHFDSKMSLR